MSLAKVTYLALSSHHILTRHILDHWINCKSNKQRVKHPKSKIYKFYKNCNKNVRFSKLTFFVFMWLETYYMFVCCFPNFVEFFKLPFNAFNLFFRQISGQIWNQKLPLMWRNNGFLEFAFCFILIYNKSQQNKQAKFCGHNFCIL